MTRKTRYGWACARSVQGPSTPSHFLSLMFQKCERHGNLCENTVALPSPLGSDVPPCFTVLDLRDSCFQKAPYVNGLPFMRFIVVHLFLPTKSMARNVTTCLQISHVLNRCSYLVFFFLLLAEPSSRPPQPSGSPVRQSTCLNVVCSYLQYPVFRGHIHGMCTTPAPPQHRARLHTRL